jgi:hypothetical protein
MTSESFRDLVRKMRSAQKEYFKTRSRLALGAAMELEKQVDLELASEPPEQNQDTFDAQRFKGVGGLNH